MNGEDILLLLHAAKACNWLTQSGLLKLEDRYVEQKKIIHLDDPEENLISAEMLKYLALGSLPFVIHTDSYSYHTHQDDYKIMLDQLWPNDWLDLRNSWIPEYNGRLPTLPRGNMRPKYFVIGDSPGIGKSPGLYDRTLTYGPSSHILRKALLKANMYYDCWFTNLVKVSQISNKPTTKEDVEFWKPYLDRELTLLEPKIIILLGNHVQEMFKKCYAYHKYTTKVFKISHPSWCLYKNISYDNYAEHIQGRIFNGITG